MCFSATASFTTAAVTGGIGIVALARVGRPRDLMLAAMPLVFALQQGVEGTLWLTLPSAPDGPLATRLTLAFLLLAQVFWPLYVPPMMLLVEPEERRRRMLMPLMVIGMGVAAYLLLGILSRPHSASIVCGHVVYVAEHPFPFAVGLAYLAATGLPLLLSTQRTVVFLGAIVLIGCVTAYAFYWEAFVSVWCFFGAAASGVILFHFERVRRVRTALALTTP